MPGNVWFIAGASSGFGRAIALEALARGDRVAAASRDPSRMTSLEDAGAMTLELDVTGSDAVIADAMQKAVDAYGPITHCVNSAGYLLEGVIEAASQEEVRRIMETNVLGTINVARCALRIMRPQRSGSTTKWAVSGFTESLHRECRPLGIAAVVIEPGYFRTEVLNEGGGHRLLTREQLLPEYEGAGLAAQKAAIARMDGSQPGDVGKGARAVVDVLTRSGAGLGREIPVRLVLGRDAVRGVGDKLRATEALLREWAGVSVGTDRDSR
ncbi:putative short chain dehydrogenase [Rosellinia necatrix]|uniref:Putative short chain dehydrogenase n=1 Tax=Rosellinia necatrix TaxID=77044 RepID=A0A1S7ULC0_ROSNE|nr:putative short chain dehydrogenase [Rosellinia necatrix]